MVALALTLVCTMNISALALEITLSHDVETNTVTGTVTTNSGIEYEPVLIQTVNENGDNVYLNQIYTDSNGRSSFNYVHKIENAGSGVMTVTAKSMTESDFAIYNQASQEEIDTILQVVKTECAKEKPDTAVLRDIYMSNADKLELDLTAYNILKDENESEKTVFSCIANDTKNKTEIHVITDVINAFYAGVAVAVINKTGQAETVVEFINDNKYVHAFDFNSIPKDAESASVFDGLTDDVKEKIYEKLATTGSKSASDLSEKLVMYTLTEELRYGDFNNAINILTVYGNAGLINVSMTKYNTVKNKSAVHKLMSGVEYTSYDAVECKFEEAVEAQYKVEHPSDNSSKVGGTGGGGNYSNKSFSFATVPQSNTDNKTETSSNSEPLSGKLIFSDMEQAKWAIEPVEALYKLGIINGTSDDSFEPNRGISRAEFVKILVCMAELPLDTSENENGFTDVAVENWYYQYAYAAFKAGVALGDDQGRFNGNKIINREEMATMLHRMIEKMKLNPAESTGLGFDDDELISDWAKESVNYLKRIGILNGRSRNFYEPKAELTRAEAAEVIYKLLKLA